MSPKPAKPIATVEAPPAPAVMDFLDYRQFLRARLESLSHIDKKFSQRWVAKRAGFKSPQLLSMIIQGQRHLSREKALHLAKVFKLESRETQYFLLIIELAECNSNVEQKAILEKIQIGFREGLFAPIREDQAVIFREWYFPAIREIVTLKDAPKTTLAYAPWIAERLGITKDQAQEALDLLVKVGFLKIEDDGFLRSEPSVGTEGGRMYPLYLGAFHMTMLERAFNAVRLGRDKRHLEFLTFAMSKKLMPELRQEIKRFMREIDRLVEAEPIRDEVCQLHLALFPLSQWQDEI